ncbi:MAG: DNA alkylation repair protein [Nitrospirales bacterium]|nr:MAG: DNA alkylation repair protein [Nitrospirales bacterium]
MKQAGKTKSISLASARQALRRHANPEKAKVHQWFFKTGKGEYGEGDHFIGVTVPQIRSVVKHYQNLSLAHVLKLLSSQIHEERLLALLILVSQFKSGDAKTQKQIVDVYLVNLQYVNNWDLVDSSAHYILGVYLSDKSRKKLYALARSSRLWDRRVAIITTLHFIKAGDFADTLKLAGLLLTDKEDLMHKAVGWMLREVGKKDQQVLENFLKTHYQQMPRTMLRYAIEKLPQEKRVEYLKGRL